MKLLVEPLYFRLQVSTGLSLSSMVREFSAPPSTVEADIVTIFRLVTGEQATDAEYLRISKNQSRKFELGVPDYD